MATLIEVDSRELIDGSKTVITLFQRAGTDEFIVEATSPAGTTSMTVGRDEAREAFMHPFSREHWLDYPGARKGREAMRPLNEEEYALLEALEAADTEEVGA